MRWNRGLASWLLSLLILSGIATLFLLPVLLTATTLPNLGGIRLPELPPPLDPIIDALEVQKLLETTYLGRGKEVPDPGEPAIVLRKYLEQNAHGYHHLLTRDELKLDTELAVWQTLTRLYPKSRHGLVALAKYYSTKAHVSGNRSYLRQAADTYIQAAEIGLTHDRIRYTRELADLLVRLGDKAALDTIFGRMLAQPEEADHDNYYLALVDYADGLARLGDDRAWNHFEAAIAFHPENNEEAINLYVRHLLDHGQPQKAVEVLDAHFTAERRINAVVPAFLRKQALEQAGLETSVTEAEITSIRQRLSETPLMGYSRGEIREKGTTGLTPTPLPEFSLSTLLTPTTAVAQVAENPVSTVFTINPANNTIWKAQLYADNATSAFVFFDAGPAKKLAALRWPKSKRAALIRIDTNNVVWYRHFDGEDWGTWQNFGQTALDVAAAAWPSTNAFPNGQADIFIVHTDGILRQRRSTNGGANWGNWTVHTPCCTVSEVAVAVAPVSATTSLLFLAARPTGLDQAVNVITSSNGTTWPTTGWTNLGQPLGGLATDLTLLAYNNTMVLVAVGADQCSLNQRHWNGGTQSNWASWVQYGTSPCTRQVSSFTTQEGDDLDKSAFLLYVRANGVLVTHRFNGTLWENGVQQGVMPWLAAVGANFEDDKDPPYEHNVLSDDCRRANQICYPDPNVPNQCFRAQTLNLAEVLYNEARSETLGAQALVGWTVRNRALQALKSPSKCGTYVGAEAGGAVTKTCRNTVPCNDPVDCESSKKYCCVMHGGTTTLGTSHVQFNDAHVPFSILYDSGFAYRAVHMLNGFIPEPSTGFIPSGLANCRVDCANPFCLSGANTSEASPEGPMEYLGYDYCAQVPDGSSLELSDCKWYAGDFCGNTDSKADTDTNPIDVPPLSLCRRFTQSQSGGDNFFWNRVAPQ